MSAYAEGAPLPVVKVVEMIGESPFSWEAAMREVLAEAQETIRGISHIAVQEFDVRLHNDAIEVFRVRVAISFRLERDPSPDYPMPAQEQRSPN